MSLADVSGTTTSSMNENTHPLMKKLLSAAKRVVDEHHSDDDYTLTQEELIRLIEAWEPQRDIICLYVRWARQLRRNFNLDSIATLLCLSRQCDYTPVNFLRQVKTLYVQRNRKSSFGITFHFEVPNRKDIDRERLNKEFLGLSVTLSLLQDQVTGSISVLGKTGMRQASPRSPYAMNIPVDGHPEGSTTTLMAHPTIEFHKHNSLLNRIWKSINHRWIVLYLIEHLFRETGHVSWSYHDALVASFQMMAPCGPCRYEFLSPLVGYCLRYPSYESIENQRTRLRNIWQDPSGFVTYGNLCLSQFTNDSKGRVILSCFQDLQQEIPSTSKKISYNRDCSWIRRWRMVRAYVFHFWLESATNEAIKVFVTKGLVPENRAKKRKHNQYQETTAITNRSPIISSAAVANRSSVISSAENHISSDKHSPTLTKAEVIPEDGNNKTTNQKVHATSIHTNRHHFDWTRLRVIGQQELDDVLRSYLLVNRNDGIQMLAQLSASGVFASNSVLLGECGKQRSEESIEATGTT
jgi:hypothetical protein